MSAYVLLYSNLDFGYIKFEYYQKIRSTLVAIFREGRFVLNELNPLVVGCIEEIKVRQYIYFKEVAKLQ